MKFPEALTFDDVLIKPAHSATLPTEAETKTRLTRQIELGIPLLSAAKAPADSADTDKAPAKRGRKP